MKRFAKPAGGARQAGGGAASRRFGWLWLCAAGAAVIAGCQCGGIEVEDGGFQCIQDSDCIDGYKCIQARCRPEGTDGGADAGKDGGTDGGNRDGGNDGGNDGGADAGSCALDAGLANCQLTACLGHSCGADGLTCSASKTCTCGGNGGVAEASETFCSDGHDNDCDGKTDCFDSNCLSLSCGANGNVCQLDGGCACGGGGGPVESPETSCSDGHDNDCNGLTDCADPNCTCETNCSDGVDNDMNGLTDCADPNCAQQSCTTDGGHVCCGTACTNLTADSLNCGGCGLACTNGHTCTKQGLTGTCNCQGANGCPGGQKCQGGTCHCQVSGDCASGEVCEATTFCGY